jgi:hypothetical protein
LPFAAIEQIPPLTISMLQSPYPTGRPSHSDPKSVIEYLQPNTLPYQVQAYPHKIEDFAQKRPREGSHYPFFCSWSRVWSYQ